MSGSRAARKQQRAIDYALLALVIVLVASALSVVVENVVGGLFVGVLAGFVIREFWPDTIGEWRKDRALIREIGPLDGPPPILLHGPDGTESIIPSTDAAYPAALTAQAQTAELARRTGGTPPRQGW